MASCICIDATYHLMTRHQRGPRPKTAWRFATWLATYFHLAGASPRQSKISAVRWPDRKWIVSSVWVYLLMGSVDLMLELIFCAVDPLDAKA